MYKAVTISYIVIAMSQFPLTIVGFWAYGNKASTFSFIELDEICSISLVMFASNYCPFEMTDDYCMIIK